jgi:ribosome maturation factor RimP
MEDKKTELKNLIRPILEEHQVFLVDMELRGQPNNQVLSIYLDTEAGITLQQISDITREIEGLLDLEDPIPGKYRLDISSPGIDRPLTEKWQYKKNVGKEILITLEENGKTVQKTGTLEALEDDRIVLIEKKQKIYISLDRIKKATIKLKW